MKRLNVHKAITIAAPVSKVWEVLIAPKFIRQWDALPEDFQDYYLEVGREIDWAGSSRLVVIEMIPHELIVQSLFSNKWDLAPSESNVTISYELSQTKDQTRLTIDVGDFSSLKEADKVQAQYSEFVDKVLGKIKSLSENKA